MKILFSYYPDSCDAQSQQLVDRLGLALANRGNDITLCAGGSECRPSSLWPKHLVHLRRLVANYFDWSSDAQRIESLRPDVILELVSPGRWARAHAARVTGTPYFALFNDTAAVDASKVSANRRGGARGTESSDTSTVLDWVLARSRGVIATNPDLGQQLAKQIEEQASVAQANCHVISPGISEAWFTQAIDRATAHRSWGLQSPAVCSYLGPLTNQAQAEWLRETIIETDKRQPQLGWLIHSQGRWQRWLEDQLTGLVDLVSLSTQQTDLRKCLAASDLILLPHTDKSPAQQQRIMAAQACLSGTQVITDSPQLDIPAAGAQIHCTRNSHPGAWAGTISQALAEWPTNAIRRQRAREARQNLAAWTWPQAAETVHRILTDAPRRLPEVQRPHATRRPTRNTVSAHAPAALAEVGS